MNRIKSKPQLLLTAYFYVAWFACVESGSRGFDGLTFLFSAIGFALFLFVWPGTSHQRLRSLTISTILCLLGFTFDVTATKMGLVEFRPITHLPMAPDWLLNLWLLFAIVVPSMSSVFKGSPTIAFTLGMIFGPLSYKSGEHWSIIQFPHPFSGILAYAVFWSLYFPLTVAVFNRFSEKFSQGKSSAV